MINDLKTVFAKIASHTYYLDDDRNEVDLVDVNQRDWSGDSPLHIAVILGDISIVEVLLDNGADVNALDERQFTALHFAAMKNNAEIIVVLLDKGADRNIKNDDGRKPLDCAISAGSSAAISVLKSKVHKKN
ncbi:ankyrin repeat domain-containing protein [Solimicrobium silvestre]|uniref:Ankyrin repeats (3 copies) n=1 Tax=Solimicrobium silvestre TaxID=2099400 RepID=A0A2S9GSB6_9BURK|nr:ankyrin repeat domain-containing protein [Solimicrobium silvestre]PRC90614.1 Ankyrin repeats (3 copies) [Solimicrobium silvestre]